MKTKNQKIIFLISIIVFLAFSPNSVQSDDTSCTQNLINTLFSNAPSNIVLCTGESGYTSSDNTWSYIGICKDSVTLESLSITSVTLNSNSLQSNLLSCFTSLTQLTLTNLSFDQDAFGSGSATNVALNTCSFKNQLISSNGNSISPTTTKFFMKINDQLNLPQLNLKTIKNLKSFELVHDITVQVNNYVTYINDLVPNETDFELLTLTSNEIPSFDNIKASDLFFNLVKASMVPSFDNFNTLNSVIGFYFNFNFDSDSEIDFPTSFSLATNIEELTLTGQLKKPTATLSLPPNTIKLTIADSPNFNIDGVFPLLLPNSLTTITISNLGLTNLPTFPQNIQSIYFENNDLIQSSSNLPDLSSYSNLKKVSFVNCGYTGSIPQSYCEYSDINLTKNNLQNSVPQCLVCYMDETYNSFSFNNNPSLTIGSCEPGSIIPNLSYDDNTKILALTGQNLGNVGPTIIGNGQQFQVVTPQSSFTLVWDESTYGTIPDTIQMYFGKDVFTLATRVLTPSIQTIKKSNSNFTFSGSNFSYNKDDIQIIVSKYQCIITLVQFNTIECYFDKKLPIGQDISATIQNVKPPTSVVVHFTVNTLYDTTTIVKFCPTDCNIGSGWGRCSSTTGECLCTTYYTGDSCSIPSPFLSSVSSTTIKGGLVNLYGWFGNVSHSDLSIRIGELNCVVHFTDNFFSNCTIGPGNGTVSVTLTQNGYVWTGYNKFHFIEPSYKCPKNCSNHGVCNDLIGQCKCNSGWGGCACNSYIPPTTSEASSSSHEISSPTVSIPQSNTTINETIGSALINNQQTTFEISILSLLELDFENNIINIYNLTNQWSTATINNSTYTFQQSIQESCLITYTIQQINTPTELEYAGLNLELEKDSIKISVLIQNYTFSSALNQLQLRLESSVYSNNTESFDNECNNKDSEAEMDGIDKNQLLNFVLLSKNNKILNAVFVNRIMSDSRQTFITNTIISNKTTSNNKYSIVIGLNLPHCTHECFIDPNFSLLVDSHFNKCQPNGRPVWVLYVSIFVPCTFFVIAAIAWGIIFRKYRTSILIKCYEHKESLNNLTRKNKDYIYMPNR
ncbi:hypothetical protein DICPUDRAFT_99765 [Dictyostelium purpureum]|uniref:EGF-like domain-containing protein n=1 Tax=Dictyostelium purpureum TaxID=5786 RepID=F1A2D0_DICPU|nr:uncharacterized protein DICPUDRAFT_99765 [Dictyostelium purpureum]EGC29656.1 hypothetical protein DICPUDRAFT_99765 [Dictyostelium purpureum]|eukprot:XP_003293825.1 hypothetical protein DICPUDRAFT_99765 [Dictyostelium purpureum]